jgi:catechol 2,3-dioxygenase-like lactoylglutathione lyase family enzyme
LRIGGVKVSELKWPNWLGVVVEDLEAQRRFYRDALGLKEIGAGDGWVLFDMGFPNIFELLQRIDGEPEYDTVRFQPGWAVDDIEATRAALIESEVEALTEIDGGPESNGYWCYFRDAEGNVFEISQRLGDTWA